MTCSNFQRIAIIGCGYVGTAVGRKMKTLGHDVAATTTSQNRIDDIQQAGMTAHLVELNEIDKLRDLLANRDTALLTYGAGQHGNYESVYVQGARNIVQAVSGSSIQRMIYTSSTRVYGQDDGSWVDEASLTNTSDPKGQQLVEAEGVLLRELANARPHPITVSVLRLGGIHGPHRELSDRILACAGQTRSDGQAYINLIHVDDIISAMVKLLYVNFHGLLNLTSDNTLTRRQIYDSILTHAEMKPIRWTDYDEPKRGKRVSNHRIKKLLQLSFS